MGEAKSTAELTVEDIQNQLNEEERLQLLTTNQPPKFIKGLRSCEARINDNFKFSVQGKNKFKDSFLKEELSERSYNLKIICLNS